MTNRCLSQNNQIVSPGSNDSKATHKEFCGISCELFMSYGCVNHVKVILVVSYVLMVSFGSLGIVGFNGDFLLLLFYFGICCGVVLYCCILLLVVFLKWSHINRDFQESIGVIIYPMIPVLNIVWIARTISYTVKEMIQYFGITRVSRFLLFGSGILYSGIVSLSMVYMPVEKASIIIFLSFSASRILCVEMQKIVIFLGDILLILPFFCIFYLIDIYGDGDWYSGVSFLVSIYLYFVVNFLYFAVPLALKRTESIHRSP